MAKDLSQIITPKELMLKKIRAALLYKYPNQHSGIDLDSSVYKQSEENPELSFGKAFTATGCDFIYCHNRFDFIDSFLKVQEQKEWENIFCSESALKTQLSECGIQYRDDIKNEDVKISITSCEALVARTGSIVFSSSQNSRILTIYPELHIVVAYTSQLCADIKDVFSYMKSRYGDKMPAMISFSTGLSRSTDLGMQTIYGVHGPKQVCLFLINDSIS